MGPRPTKAGLPNPTRPLSPGERKFWNREEGLLSLIPWVVALACLPLRHRGAARPPAAPTEGSGPDSPTRPRPPAPAPAPARRTRAAFITYDALTANAEVVAVRAQKLPAVRRSSGPLAKKMGGAGRMPKRSAGARGGLSPHSRPLAAVLFAIH